MQNIRNEFVNHVDKFIALTGNITENTGKTILGFETKLANIQLSNVELRDPDSTYNKVSMSDLKKISGKIDWSVFARKQDVISDTIIVQNLNYYHQIKYY
jgi:putative endopeptidase